MQLYASSYLSPREAVTLGDARDEAFADPKKTAMVLHVNWGNGPAQ